MEERSLSFDSALGELALLLQWADPDAAGRARFAEEVPDVAVRLPGAVPMARQYTVPSLARK